jgi:hypothetical protein
MKLVMSFGQRTPSRRQRHTNMPLDAFEPVGGLSPYLRQLAIVDILPLRRVAPSYYTN